MAYPGWRIRDKNAPRLRFALMEKMEMVPFYHQAQIFAYLDCKDIAPAMAFDVSDIPQFDTPALRTYVNKVEYWLIAIPRFVEKEVQKWGEKEMEQFPELDPAGNPIVAHHYYEVYPTDRPRPDVLAMSCAFKAGKSQLGGLIPASFGNTPGLKWDLYGLEYDICEPELEYILDAFLSEKGLNLQRVRDFTGDELIGYIRWKSEPSMGKMYLELSNGARYACRSLRKVMETKSDPLKGKERDGFSICEMYQFPSIQSVLSYQQNLAIRRGYYIMPSTPDRPIMDEVNLRSDPENMEWETWLGVTEIHRRENPYAFVERLYFQDLKTYTREEFCVYWEGKSGRWIGAVYPEVKFFDTVTHPELWHDPEKPPEIENFNPPPWFKRLGGVDTATLYGVVSALGDEKGNVYFLHGVCNYRYATGQIEQRHEVTVQSVCQEVRDFRNSIGGVWGASYADPNTQWGSEFRSNGVPLRKGQKDPELRCEITRGMAQNGFIWFAPWLRGSTLVMEFEIAKYPPKELSTRVRKRLDRDDHLLDPAEHLCAKYSAAIRPVTPDPQNPVKELMRRRRPNTFSGDPMMGDM